MLLVSIMNPDQEETVSDESDRTDSNTTFGQKPSQKKPIPWYESNLLGPLAIALIGAFIAASAQITATILPIYFGPANLCDFSITINPGTDNILMHSRTGSTNIEENISITDLHQWIKPYKHPVYVKVIGSLPPGVVVGLQNKVGRLPLNIQMDIKIDNSTYEPKEYEIIIQGIGEDGLVRNSTYFLNLQDRNTTKNEGYRTYSNMSVGYAISPFGSGASYITRDEYMAKISD